MGFLLSLYNEPLTCRRLQCLYESAKKNKLPKEMSSKRLLPEAILNELYQHIGNLNGRHAEKNFSDVQILDNSSFLQEAIIKVANEHFPDFNISEQISPYQHLLNIYEAAQENSLSELTRLEISLLPIELRIQMFSHINEKNGKPAGDKFGEVHVLDDPTLLKDAIDEVKEIMFEEVKQFFAQGKVYKITQLINYYGIQDQQDLIKIAKLCANADACDLSYSISRFGIQDQQALVEIAKHCAKQAAKETANNIRNFGIKNEDALVEIAKLCAKQAADETAQNIQNFGIKNEQALFEIAKLCAKQAADETAQNIQNFGIKNEQALFEIAKLCAGHIFYNTAEFIQNFGIQDQTNLIEIVKLCAQKNAHATASCIKELGFQDQNTLIEIAKLCAQKNAGVTVEYIKNFGIQDQNALIEIAKICAKGSVRDTIILIRQLGIQDQNVLVEIAKLCAQGNGDSTAFYIKNFGIQDQYALIEIAKLCAEGTGDSMGDYIKNFEIEDRNALIEIAKLCAKRNVVETIKYIRINKSSIWDQNSLIEIAKLCAKTDSDKTTQHIKSFGIQDQQALFEIAKLCAYKGGRETACYVKNFGIQDLNQFRRIYSLCSITNPNSLLLRTPMELALYGASLRNYLEQLIDPLNCMQNNKPRLEDVKSFLIQSAKNVIEKHINPNSPFLDKIACLEDVENIHDLIQVSTWLASMLFFIATLDPDQQELMFKTDLFTTLLQIRDPDLRRKLSFLLVEFASISDSFKTYLQHTASEQAPIKKALDFVLLGLQFSGVKKETTDHVKSLIGPIFHDKVEARSLVETLFLLNQTLSLQGKDKDRILELLYEGAIKGPREKNKDHVSRLVALKPKMRQRVFALLAVLLFQNEALLQTGSSIIECAKATFQDKLHLNALDEDFVVFQKLFMTDRNPDALITYAAKLSSHKDPDAIQDLCRYIKSVLKRSFLEERYQLENNPHLKIISEHFPNLLEQWKSPLESISIKLLDEKVDSFHPRSWLQNKVEHGHLNPHKLPHIKALLRQEAVDEDALLPIEKALQNFLRVQDKLEQITALEVIQKELQNLSPCEFQNDIAGQLGILKNNSIHSQEKVDVVDTDNYLDLLLCGTEVVGSCQNVNGTPSFNKGLLGYLLDGKNRLIALKNRQGKIIARAKLSLLWDGQKPALFLENMYTQGKFQESCSQAIAKMALAKAQLLGIPLTANNKNDYSELQTLSVVEFDKPLFSLGGGISYEYVDACQNIQKNGIYEINPAKISELRSV